MTLQDFVSTINDSLASFGQTSLPFLVPLTAAIFSILIGVLIATLLTNIINSLSSLLSVEKSLQKLDGYKNLGKLSKTFTLTGFISKLIWVTTLLLFLFIALQFVGYKDFSKTLKLIFDFLPNLVTGSLILLFGTVLAYFASAFITVFGNLGKFPVTTFFSKLVAAVILIFSVYQALIGFGISDEIVRFITIGSIAAGSLSLGLGTKDLVSQTIRNIWNQKL